MSSLNVLNALGMKPFCRCLMYLMCDNMIRQNFRQEYKKVLPLVKTGYIDDLACLLKAQPVRFTGECALSRVSGSAASDLCDLSDLSDLSLLGMMLQVNGDIPPRLKKSAHEVILEFIRSRPPLNPVRAPPHWLCSSTRADLLQPLARQYVSHVVV